MRQLPLLLSLILIISAPARAADLGTDAQRAAGKALYEKHCSQCHGDAGDGKGFAANFVKPAPRDFTTGKYKIRHTPTGDLPLNDDIKNAIVKGLAFHQDGAYTAMPPWPKFREEEVTNVMYYLKTFSKDFANDQYNHPREMKVPAAPQFTAESAKKGREIFEKNECIKCHGVYGRGDGKSAPTLKDDWGQHIRPADLTKRFTYRGGGSREDIFRTISTGLNGTPMPAYEDSIPVEARWNLVDYIYSLSTRDRPQYNQADQPIVVMSIKGAIEITDFAKATELFAAAPSAIIPVVGQVVEPGRSFHPGINELELRAIYNNEDIALMVRWHDLQADKSGGNSPAAEVVEETPKTSEVVKAGSENDDPFGEEESDPFGDEGSGDDPFAEESSGAKYSDAVLVQIPQTLSGGFKMPYFLFGDSQNGVELWFQDLAKSEAESWIGKGSTDVKKGEVKLSSVAAFEDGQWTVIFKRAREISGSVSFAEKTFVPVAFSVWDGFNEERGVKRGITTWFQMYLEPMEKPSAVLPMLLYGGGLLLLEILVIAVARWRAARRS